MTDDYVFRINGKKKPFGRSKLMRLSDNLPDRVRVQVIDTRLCKPVGNMTVMQAKRKFI